mmetsp:Transcript_16170/g.27359  ORF Transcript_16170/g.27359 Transcript_16170/m.27359 type:complete len:330 (+) Transcript_16170:558-1547(+)
MPYFHCELTGGLNRVCFSTADDPFQKASISKYFPEAIIFSPEGELVGRVNPETKRNEKYPMHYSEDIRDPVLKINDDRKIHLALGGIKEPGTMIMLVVKNFDNRNKTPPSEGEFDRAWFRLYNEDTNQTIDYSLIKNIDLPEDYQEVIPPTDEEDENAQGTLNALTYFHGILYLENKNGVNKWVFESYKHVFQAKDYEDIEKTLGEIYINSFNENQLRESQLNETKNTLKKSIEDKRQQALEAAKKAKAKNKKKGGKPEDDPELEEQPKSEHPLKDEEFDLFLPSSFQRALAHQIKRPFIFGPVEFIGLNLSEEEMAFEAEDQRDRVTG